MGGPIVKPISLVTLLSSLTVLLATSTFAIDSPRPPTKAGSTPAPPSSGSAPPGGGSSTPPPGGSSGSQNPGFFADVVGTAMPLVYCRAGEPCDVAVRFANTGAAVAASQAIPDPTWTINGQPANPTNIQRWGAGPGWATQEVKQWTARFTIPSGGYEVRATMPRLPTEKEAANNVATRPVTVGQPDMAVKLERDNVDYNTRYEIKAEVQNKGTVPTKALAVLAVLVVDVTHMSAPPTPTQCIGNPNLSGCVIERHSVESLAPGQKKRWKIGSKQLISTSVRARAQVACADPGPCADLNPGNNTDAKTFGP
jgi:hypothetical protein